MSKNYYQNIIAAHIRNSARKNLNKIIWGHCESTNFRISNNTSLKELLNLFYLLNSLYSNRISTNNRCKI